MEYIEADREKPLLKIINNLGGWDVLRSFNLYNWDPHRVLRELHADFRVSAFFEVDVMTDFRNPGQNIIRISPSGLGMPDKTYYHRFPNDSSIQVNESKNKSIIHSTSLLFRHIKLSWRILPSYLGPQAPRRQNLL